MDRTLSIGPQPGACESCAATTRSAPPPSDRPPGHCRVRSDAAPGGGQSPAPPTPGDAAVSRRPGRRTGCPGLRGAVRLAAHRRDVVDQRQQFVDVGHVGPGVVGHQRHALTLGQDMVLGPGFASIRRIGAGLIAAPQGSGLGTIDRGAGPIELVGLLEPSAKRIWCNFSQTPARCQALR